MEDYCQEVGRAGQDGLPAKTDIFFNSYDISKPRKNMEDVMRNYVHSKECKRKMILSYFDHKVPSMQGPAHTCCDFCNAQCVCELCLLAPDTRTKPVILQQISVEVRQLLLVLVFKQK